MNSIGQKETQAGRSSFSCRETSEDDDEEHGWESHRADISLGSLCRGMNRDVAAIHLQNAHQLEVLFDSLYKSCWFGPELKRVLESGDRQYCMNDGLFCNPENTKMDKTATRVMYKMCKTDDSFQIK